MYMDLTKALHAMDVAKQAAPKLADLKKATQNFESIFIKNLLTTMRKSVKEVDFGDKTGSDVYKDMMDQNLSDSLSKTSSFGVSKMLYTSYAPKVLAMVEKDMMVAENAAKRSGSVSQKTPTLLDKSSRVPRASTASPTADASTGSER